MNKILFILLVSLLVSCIPQKIYREFDEFENLRKFKLTQIYNAKKDFTGSRQIKIKYYKFINQSGLVNISARLIVYSSVEDGKLSKQLDIRLANKIYESSFYNYQSNYDAHHDFNIDDANEDYETTGISHNADENIRHLADFDISNELADKIMKAELLSFRFYIGKEAYTVRFSKFELKQLKKFLMIQ